MAPVRGTASDAGASPASPRRDGGLSWVLLPVAWCTWLLAWLVPVLLVAPHLPVPRVWMTRETAPAAVLLAAALFLAAIWPFWPALAREGYVPRRAGGRWIGLSILEVIILLALAAPFALVAWSVGGRTIEPWPLAAGMAGLVAFALGLRMAVGGLPTEAARWLMLAAMLISAGPPLVAYAVGETMSVWNLRLLEASPLVSSLRLTLQGWPAGAWPIFTQLVLWPLAGVILAVVGLATRHAAVRPATRQ